MITIYRITVKPLSNQGLLTFKGIKEYTVKDGFVIFRNLKNNEIKRFAVSNVEIEEEVSAKAEPIEEEGEK